MKRQYMQFHGYGNEKKPLEIPLQKGGYFNSNLKNNQCVSAYCTNPVHVVYITPNGLACNGYCWTDARQHCLANALRLENSKGCWFVLSDGKLQPFDSEIGTLKTILSLLKEPKKNIKAINNIIANKKTKIKHTKSDFN